MNYPETKPSAYSAKDSAERVAREVRALAEEAKKNLETTRRLERDLGFVQPKRGNG